MKPAPVKPEIGFDVLEQLDVRVGTIVEVLDMENSRKLVHLQVDFGDHQRSIVVGMKQERADPTEVTGKQALFVLNLAEKEMGGVTSQGILFDIGYADGVTPCLAIPEQAVPNGTRAG